MQEGRGYRLQIPQGEDAARPLGLHQRRPDMRAASRSIGYCWGGTLAYLAACELPVSCAVSYYGGQIARITSASRRSRPVMYHFGEKDPHIPAVRHREDPRGRSERHLPPVPGGSRVQLRGARPPTTRPARSSRASARSRSSPRKWRRNDQARRFDVVEEPGLHRRRLARRRFGPDHRDPQSRQRRGARAPCRTWAPPKTRRAIEAAQRRAARVVEEDRGRAREDPAQVVRPDDGEPGRPRDHHDRRAGQAARGDRRARSPTPRRSSSGSPRKASASTATSSRATRPTSASWCCASPSASSRRSRRGISPPR